MKTTGFCLFEYDDNQETLITFIYPSVDNDLRTVILETANFLISSNSLSLFSSYKSKYLYFEALKNTNKTNDVRLYGICVITDDLHPTMYSTFAQILCKMYVDTENSPKILRAFLSAQTDGVLEYQKLSFSDDNYEDCFHECSFDVLLDRVLQYIPIIWQAVVTGKSIAVYSPEVAILQSCAVPILSLCIPGNRPLLPLVIENSSLQTEAAEDLKYPIWCSCDPSVLSNRFDLVIDLSSRNVKLSPSFAKEAGKSNLLESLMNSINETTASDASVADTLEQFNQQIINMLRMVKTRLGDLSPQSISSVNLPASTKLVLTAIASCGILNI
ncbi:FAM45 family protein [Histomonas meleagridis]|uniref:FAM45 family protein n=1 Tax=Histomonas meleagridis TaxID=135588 RepID=UPI00355AA04C|nr:FAM45 family protein [Histomonas meleagridis]KAH0799739.1 FAM45 family protein [Histomonas meleagridis]